MEKDICNKLQGIPGATQSRIINVVLQVRNIKFLEFGVTIGKGIVSLLLKPIILVIQNDDHNKA